MIIRGLILQKIVICTFLLVNILPLANSAEAQVFNYGLKIGAGSFNQKWEFSGFGDSFHTGWNKEKAGLTFHIFGELEHGKHFGTKLELGYINKGCIQDQSIEAPDGTVHGNDNKKISYNTITIGLSERIIFFKSKFRPYLKFGFNVNIIPKDEIENSGIAVREKKTGIVVFFGDQFYPLDWNNITINATLGLGVSFKQLMFIELEYIPAITKLLDMKYMNITDRYFGLSVGININQLYK